MLIIFISYEFAGVYEPNLKMQEVALCNIAATDTQKWVDTVTCWLFESRSYSFKLLTVSLHFTTMLNTQCACNIRLF